MRVLVTGGSGFIGGNFIRHLAKKHPDWFFVNFSRGKIANPLENQTEKEKLQIKNYEFIKGDLQNKKLLQRALAGVDYVFHFAAESNVRKANEAPLEFMKANILGTQSLLEALKGKLLKKVVYLSSSEVYGYHRAPEDGFTEADRLNPEGIYAASKAAAEILSLAYHNSSKIPVIIARTCNVFGPRQRTDKIIPRFITNLIQNLKIPIYGAGEDYRTYVYVNDLCQALEILAKDGNQGEIYNIATHDTIPNIELARSLIKKLGKEESLIEFVPNTKSGGEKFSINAKKITALGWQQKTSFEQGLEKTIQWYKQN